MVVLDQTVRAPRLSRSFEVNDTDTDRSATYDFFLVINGTIQWRLLVYDTTWHQCKVNRSVIDSSDILVLKLISVLVFILFSSQDFYFI